MVKFLGLCNSATVENPTAPGMLQIDAANGQTRLAVFMLDWQNPSASMANVPNMVAAGNGDYKAHPLQATTNERINSALALYNVVEESLRDNKIDVAEGLKILQAAAQTATGKTSLQDQFSSVFDTLSGLYSKATASKSKPVIDKALGGK